MRSVLCTEFSVIPLVSLRLVLIERLLNFNSGNLLLFRIPSAVKPGYNDIGLCDTPSITSDILWYQFIPHC
jgi:hypothetical protein